MNKNTDRKKIGILFGGCSTEYEVSLQSATSVITHLDKEKYEAVLIGIDKKGMWYLYQGEIADIEKDKWFDKKTCLQVAISPDKELHGILVFGQEGVTKISLDAACPVLHGKNGEDGTVQGVLELAGIPIIGCGTLASAVGMEKDMAHRLVAAAGIKVPKAYCFTKHCEWTQVQEWAEQLSYPLFVKPVRAGSSFGITKVKQPKQLKEAVKLAFEHDEFCIMEEAIPGFEVGCAVLGHPWEELIIGEVDEIELSSELFDYEEKYTLKTSNIYVPARISKEKSEEIKKTAARIYRILDCDYFARVDMFLTPQGEIYFNEINTIPGFTSHSRYPSMMKAIGISFDELMTRLLNMALEEKQ